MKKLKFLKTFENYSEDEINNILDDISKNGIDSITPLQKKTLNTIGGHNKKEYNYDKKTGIITFRGMKFTVEDDQLIILEPSEYSGYEGSYLSDYKGDPIGCILSTIADYFDIRHRDEALKLSKEDLEFISNNFTEEEQRGILANWSVKEVNDKIGKTRITDDDINNIGNALKDYLSDDDK